MPRREVPAARRTLGVAAIAMILLAAAAVLAPSARADEGGDHVDRATNATEAIVETCVEGGERGREACADWARNDVPAWAVDYSGNVTSWTNDTAAWTAGFGQEYAADLSEWAKNRSDDLGESAESLEADGEALYGWAQDWTDRNANPQRGPPCSDDRCGPDLRPGCFPECQVGDVGDLDDLGDLPNPPSLPPTPGLGSATDWVESADPPDPEFPSADLDRLAPGSPPLPDDDRENGSPNGGSTGAAVSTNAAPGGRIQAAADQGLIGAPDPTVTIAGKLDVPVLGSRPGVLPSVAIATGLFLVGLGSLAAARLYRRLSKDELLDNDLRSEIVDIVEDEPGIHVAALTDRLDVAMTTVLYHVRLLEEFDHLSLDEAGRETRCYLPTQGSEVRKLQPYLRSAAKRELLELVARRPGINMSEAARRLDKDRSTVKYHVDALLEAEVLATEADGASKGLAVPEAVRAAVVQA